MKKLIVTTVILLFAVIAGQAQEKKKGLYSVAFYNLENLSYFPPESSRIMVWSRFTQ